VETVARSEGDRVREVTLKWTPSFVVLADQVVEVEGVGEVRSTSRSASAMSSPS